MMPTEPMFIDTNLFLRYLTNDIPERVDAVEKLLRKAADGEETLVTSSLVIAEIVWTLESFYQLGRWDIREKILAILNTEGLNVEDDALILPAIQDYVELNVDFIDAYNVAWMLSRGITDAYTFDRKHFKRFDAITVHQPEKTSPPSV